MLRLNAISFLFLFGTITANAEEVSLSRIRRGLFSKDEATTAKPLTLYPKLPDLPSIEYPKLPDLPSFDRDLKPKQNNNPYAPSAPLPEPAFNPFAPSAPLPEPDTFPNAPYPKAPYPNAPYPNAPYPKAPYPNAPYPNAPYPKAPYPNAPYPNAPYPNAPYAPNAPYPGSPGNKNHPHENYNPPYYDPNPPYYDPNQSHYDSRTTKRPLITTKRPPTTKKPTTKVKVKIQSGPTTEDPLISIIGNTLHVLLSNNNNNNHKTKPVINTDSRLTSSKKIKPTRKPKPKFFYKGNWPGREYAAPLVMALRNMRSHGKPPPSSFSNNFEIHDTFPEPIASHQNVLRRVYISGYASSDKARTAPLVAINFERKETAGNLAVANTTVCKMDAYGVSCYNIDLVIQVLVKALVMSTETGTICIPSEMMDLAGITLQSDSQRNPGGSNGLPAEVFQQPKSDKETADLVYGELEGDSFKNIVELARGKRSISSQECYASKTVAETLAAILTKPPREKVNVLSLF